jgi:uncharacterized protein CbrC (UPF0167 family)
VRRNRLKARERLERLVGRGRTAKLNLGPIDAEETMMLPQFRFHPTAFAEGRVFEQTDEACAGCGRSAGWRYVGPLYARQKVQPCPDCIANGRVAAFVGDANFSFFDTDLREVGPEWQEELLRRTPGFAVFNPFPWPAKDGVPLAFVGYGDEPALWEDQAARAAMTEAFAEELESPSPYALVFRELEGAGYRVVVDLD